MSVYIYIYIYIYVYTYIYPNVMQDFSCQQSGTRNENPAMHPYKGFTLQQPNASVAD